MPGDRMRHPLRVDAEARYGRVLVDRGDALYFVPRSGERVYADEAGAREFVEWAGVEPIGLGAELVRFAGRPVRAEELDLFQDGIKQLELGATAQSRAAYERRLRQLAAVVMREGVGGGLLYACWAVGAFTKADR